ncbi:MAG: reductive dehalogenase [Marinifilaceae bacterium]|jgi:reductive dehalogenase|nr:reductive dehalogenase [Marinifilaceae bacterium]
MCKNKELSKVLKGKSPIGKYSKTNYKIIDKPTTEIVGEIERFDERKTGFNRAFRGEYGSKIKNPKEKIKSGIDMSIMSYFFQSGKMPDMSQKGGKPEIGNKDSGMSKSPMSFMKGSLQKKPKPLHSDIKVVSRHIKSYGDFMGADLVGICEIPDYAYYSHDKDGSVIQKKYKYAICIAVDQDYDTLDASDGKDWISAAQSFMSYSKAAFIASAMAKYVQMQGFDAKDNHLMDYQVIVPPLLELAGIGEMGRYGIVINPSLGSRFKASVVLTNMPMATDKPIKFGVQAFCKVCKKCAIECPSQSISKSDNKIVHNGYKKYDFDYANCSKFRLSNPNGSSCGKCIKVCPFNKSQGWIHDLARWTIRNLPIMNKLIVWGDDLLGYGKARPEKKWWFDVDKSILREKPNVTKVQEKDNK